MRAPREAGPSLDRDLRRRGQPQQLRSSVKGRLIGDQFVCQGGDRILC